MASSLAELFADIDVMGATEIGALDGYKTIPPGSHYFLFVPKRCMDKSAITPLCVRNNGPPVMHMRGFSAVVKSAISMMKEYKSNGPTAMAVPPGGGLLGGTTGSTTTTGNQRGRGGRGAPPNASGSGAPANNQSVLPSTIIATPRAARQRAMLSANDMTVLDVTDPGFIREQQHQDSNPSTPQQDSIYARLEFGTPSGVATDGRSFMDNQFGGSLIDGLSPLHQQGTDSVLLGAATSSPGGGGGTPKEGEEQQAIESDAESSDRGMNDILHMIGNVTLTEENQQYQPSATVAGMLNAVYDEVDPNGLGNVDIYLINDDEYIVYVMVIPNTVGADDFNKYMAVNFPKKQSKGGTRQSKGPSSVDELTADDSSHIFCSYVDLLFRAEQARVLKKNFSQLQVRPQRIYSLGLMATIIYRNYRLGWRLFGHEGVQEFLRTKSSPAYIHTNGIRLRESVQLYRVENANIFTSKKLAYSGFPWVDKDLYDYMRKDSSESSVPDMTTRRSQIFFGSSASNMEMSSLSVYHPLEKLSKYHMRHLSSGAKLDRSAFEKRITRLEYALTNSSMRKLYSDGYLAVLKWPEQNLDDPRQSDGYLLYIADKYCPSIKDGLFSSLGKCLASDYKKVVENYYSKNRQTMPSDIRIVPSQLSVHLAYMHRIYLNDHTLLPVFIPIIDCFIPGLFNCFSRNRNLHLNVILSGKPSAGKTDVVNVLEANLIRGTIDKGTDSSELAYVVDSAIGMDISYVPEAMPHLTDAKPMGGSDRVRLERMKTVTSDMSQTRNVCAMDDTTGKRVQRKVVCDWFTCLVVVMNEKRGNYNESPLAARFVHFEIPKSDKDSSAEKMAKRYISSSADGNHLNKEAARLITSSIQYVSCVIHAAIDTHVIQPPDMTLSILVLVKFLENMKHLGLDSNRLNEIRSVIRVNLLNTEYCILHAILDYYRLYKKKNSDFFEFSDLKGIEPLLYSRVEQICLSFGLLIHQYAEPVVSSIFEATCELFNMKRNILFPGIEHIDTKDPLLDTLFSNLDSNITDLTYLHQFKTTLSVIKKSFDGFPGRVVSHTMSAKQDEHEKSMYNLYKKQGLTENDPPSSKDQYVSILKCFEDELSSSLDEAMDSIQETVSTRSVSPVAKSPGHTSPPPPSLSPPSMTEVKRIPRSEEWFAVFSECKKGRSTYTEEKSLHFSGLHPEYITKNTIQTMKQHVEKLDQHTETMFGVIESYIGAHEGSTIPKETFDIDISILMRELSEATNRNEPRPPPTDPVLVDSDDEEEERADTEQDPDEQENTNQDTMQQDETEEGDDDFEEPGPPMQTEETAESSSQTQEGTESVSEKLYHLMLSVMKEAIDSQYGQEGFLPGLTVRMERELFERIIVYACYHLDRIMLQVYSEESLQKTIRFKTVIDATKLNQNRSQSGSSSGTRQLSVNRDEYRRELDGQRSGGTGDTGGSAESGGQRMGNNADHLCYCYNRVLINKMKREIDRELPDLTDAKPSQYETEKSTDRLHKKIFCPLFSYDTISSEAHKQVMDMYISRKNNFSFIQRIEYLSKIVPIRVNRHGATSAYIFYESDPQFTGGCVQLDVRSLLLRDSIDIQSLFTQTLSYQGLEHKIFECVDSASRFNPHESPSRIILLCPDENVPHFSVPNPLHSDSSNTRIDDVINKSSMDFVKAVNRSKYTRKRRNRSGDDGEDDGENDGDHNEEDESMEAGLSRLLTQNQQEDLMHDVREGATIQDFVAEGLECSASESSDESLFNRKERTINISQDLDEWSRMLRIKSIAKQKVVHGSDAVRYMAGVVSKPVSYITL